MINPDADIQKVLKVLDHNLFSIVVDDNNKCIGTITDGDLRRALIKGNTADLTAYDICEKILFLQNHIMKQKLSTKILDLSQLLTKIKNTFQLK